MIYRQSRVSCWSYRVRVTSLNSVVLHNNLCLFPLLATIYFPAIHTSTQGFHKTTERMNPTLASRWYLWQGRTSSTKRTTTFLLTVPTRDTLKPYRVVRCRAGGVGDLASPKFQHLDCSLCKPLFSYQQMRSGY